MAEIKNKPVSAIERLAELDDRLGPGIGAAKERARLAPLAAAERARRQDVRAKRAAQPLTHSLSGHAALEARRDANRTAYLDPWQPSN